MAFDGVIYFSNYTDSRVYRVKEGEQPEAVVPGTFPTTVRHTSLQRLPIDNKNHRFACLAVHPKHPHLLVAILENHTKPKPSDVTNILCVIDTNRKTVTHLVSGADFYACPCFTPDGTHIAWQQWHHPDMPWEGSEICVADVTASETDLSVSNTKVIAGKRTEISAAYPRWATDDLLFFLSDVSDYYNPWKYSIASGAASAVLTTPAPEDFAQPQWSLGFSFGTPLDAEGKTALYSALRGGRSVLYIVSTASGALEELACPYVALSSVQRVTHDTVVFRGARNEAGPQTAICNIEDYALPQFTVIGPQKDEDEYEDLQPYVAMPQPMTLTAQETGEPVHVLYYPPTNPNYTAPEGEKPPAVFYAHGGPTSVVLQGLSWSRTWYTSRGYAWCVTPVPIDTSLSGAYPFHIDRIAVNYGGSSGYGRKYM